jgi:MipA family protein
MKILFALASAALLLPFQAAIAQDGDDIRLRIGLGGQIRPQFIGAGKSEWGPLWDIAIQRGTGPFDFEAPDDNFDIRLFTSAGFSLGPVANIQSGRKDLELGAPIGRVPTTFEAGFFAQYELSDTIRLRGEVRRGIGGHEGFVANLGGDRVWRDGDRFVFSMGPRLLLSDARYQRAWFGVSPRASTDSGLPQYRPDGGIYAIALSSGLTYQLSRRWGLFGFARYERLVGSAAKSPIVRQLGSKNQPSAGLGLTHIFNIKR